MFVFFSDFCYIVNYLNSDRIKFLAGSKCDKEGESLHSQQKVRFTKDFEHLLMGYKYEKNQPFGR